MSRPKAICTTSSVSPMCRNLPSPATTSAPITAPAPENAIITAYWPAAWWNTSCAKIGMKVSSGSPRNVLMNASVVSVTSARSPRM